MDDHGRDRALVLAGHLGSQHPEPGREHHHRGEGEGRGEAEHQAHGGARAPARIPRHGPGGLGGLDAWGHGGQGHGRAIGGLGVHGGLLLGRQALVAHSSQHARREGGGRVGLEAQVSGDRGLGSALLWPARLGANGSAGTDHGVGSDGPSALGTGGVLAGRDLGHPPSRGLGWAYRNPGSDPRAEWVLSTGAHCAHSPAGGPVIVTNEVLFCRGAHWMDGLEPASPHRLEGPDGWQQARCGVSP